MRVVLIATYELGRQPFGLASPAAWLRAAGHDVASYDLSRDTLDPAAVAGAGLVAFHLPMHTATRMALPVVAQVRARAAQAHLCAYGLYAPPNAALLRERGVASVIGPEYEADLVALADALAAGMPPPAPAASLPRLAFGVPERAGLPPLTRYARLTDAAGVARTVGSTEATRGCKHRCRHCPIVPVYGGQFRVVPVDVVLADIAQQVAQGATHITFGDADFFNGVTHARRVVDALATRHPGVTYDVTIKVEHLLRHRELLPTLVQTGCAFVTSAFESFDDDVLAVLDKGHTRADARAVLTKAREAGLALVPTFVAFGPWTTVERYAAFLETLDAWDLVDAVAPVQLALRLLLPSGSLLVDHPAVASRVGPFDSDHLAFSWVHADPRVDTLQREVMAIVSAGQRVARRDVFERVVAHVRAMGTGVAASVDRGRTRGTAIATLDEPWYC